MEKTDEGGPGGGRGRAAGRPGLAWTAAGFYLAVFLAGFIWLRLQEKGVFARDAFEPGTLARDAGLGAAAGAAVVALSAAASRFLGFARRLEAEFKGIIGDLTAGEIVVIALLSGIAEEYFFRGAAQPALGIAAASILFGALHIGPGRVFLPWTVFAAGMGFLLGALYEHTHSLTAPALSHAVVNLVNLARINRIRLPAPGQGGGGDAGAGSS